MIVGCTGERVKTRSPDVGRGGYLANGIGRCFWCHSPLDSGNPAYPRQETLGAGDTLDAKSQLYAPNLTPDPESGLGKWTDGEIIRAMREGRGRDGRTLREHPSAYYSVMTDEDAAAVVAYLRTIKPVRKSLPRSAPARATGNSVQPTVRPAKASALRTKLARGRYLVQLGECMGCHTTTTAEGNPNLAMRFGGGRLFAIENGVGAEYSGSSQSGKTASGAPIVASANITRDASGIPYYTEEIFVKTIRSGRVAGVRPLSAAMPWIFFRNMTGEDLRAIFAYLRTMPAVAHNVINSERPSYCRRCGRWHGGGDSNRN